MSQETRAAPYSFIFNAAADSWVCSIHGQTDFTAWVPCWNGCQDGYFDAYEDDPINNDEGDLEMCDACGGAGGWTVCGECNIKNEDAEFLIRAATRSRRRKAVKLTPIKRLAKIAEIIEDVDRRCEAYDGPVGMTKEEISEDELRQIYKLAKRAGRAPRR